MILWNQRQGLDKYWFRRPQRGMKQPQKHIKLSCKPPWKIYATPFRAAKMLRLFSLHLLVELLIYWSFLHRVSVAIWSTLYSWPKRVIMKQKISINYIWFFRTAAPNILGTGDQFPGRQFVYGPVVWVGLRDGDGSGSKASVREADEASPLTAHLLPCGLLPIRGPGPGDPCFRKCILFYRKCAHFLVYVRLASLGICVGWWHGGTILFNDI